MFFSARSVAVITSIIQYLIQDESTVLACVTKKGGGAGEFTFLPVLFPRTGTVKGNDTAH